MLTLHRHLRRVIVLLWVAGAASAEVTVVPQRLAFDALVLSTAHFYRFTSGGVSSNDPDFERAAALVGFTGRIGSVASARGAFDIGGYWGGAALDMYADLSWTNGAQVRAGQFLLPLGFDLMTNPSQQLLVNNSLLAAYAAPAGNRDIGLLGGLQRGILSVTGAVINGAGSNTGDNNKRKDACGRVIVRPLAALDGVFAVRAYYGWPDASDSVWQTAAVEARVRTGPLELQAEFQNHRSSDVRNSAAYLQGVWDIGLVEPVGRFDLVMPRGEHLEWMVTGGVNLEPVSDHLRVMLDFTYRRNYQANWSIFGFLFRLQAAI
jgi:hypothetical protein